MREKDSPSVNGDSSAGEQELSLKGFWQNHRREVLAGAAVIFLLFVAGTGFLIRNLFEGQEAAEKKIPAEVAVIDSRKVWYEHPDYDKYQQMKAEAAALQLDLEARDEMSLAEVQPPTLDGQPFQDSVWQKNAQTVIGGRVQLEREWKQAEKDYREATREAYEAQRSALDEEYLNDILNINLKLDNQQQMHHPWVKEEELAAERAVWEQEAEALKQERGERQHQLRLAWDEQVRAHVEAVMAPKLAAWEEQSKAALDQQKSAALSAEAEAQARNMELMSRHMALSAKVQEHIEKRQRLAELRQNLESLENHIINDIAGKAAKLAILHHYTLILAVPMPSLGTIFPGGQAMDFSQPRFGQVIGENVEDVTDELVAEVRTIKSTTNE